ncbi:unnamed protein product [Nesidiocoris tenuis]|uniref:Uncharacterized protein n=1 Tax=Nesidiocoris tenuis TaxID=355587 RepID=A0A6H5HTQ8_9HEMI|nr:unnamed protein product [Nesidiocoris tenuis]CAB0020344.1 unnamed protein product [Nesidiocoris tenuis]
MVCYLLRRLSHVRSPLPRTDPSSAGFQEPSSRPHWIAPLPQTEPSNAGLHWPSSGAATARMTDGAAIEHPIMANKTT